MASIPSSTSTTSSRRVGRLTELQPDADFLEGLKCLDASIGGSDENTNTTNVKTVVEQKTLASYEQLLGALAEADKRFLGVADSVATLAAEGDKARSVLSKCAAASGALLTRVDSLVAELAEVQQREQRISAFIRSFQISDEDAVILRKGDVSPDFLAALAKLQQIHDSCKRFAHKSNTGNDNSADGGGDTAGSSSFFEQQQAAVEVMESTFLLHMSAMDRLATYIANAAPEVCGTEASALDASPLFIDALKALQSNPGMWAKAVQEVARVRRAALLRRLGSHTAQLFREANARQQQQQQQQQQQRRGGGGQNQQQDGSNSSTSNSVSLRLLGDLCAWLDESAAEERSSAQAFFPHQQTSTHSVAHRAGSTSSLSAASGDNLAEQDAATSSTAAHLTLSDYLDSVFDAAARQLKLRAVETVNEMSEAVWPRGGGGAASATTATSSSSAAALCGPNSILEEPGKMNALVSLYKAESLFAFYGGRVGDIFGKNSAVVAALNDARLEAMRLFYELLSGVAGVIRSVVATPLRAAGSGGGSGGDGTVGDGNDRGDDGDGYLGVHPHVSAACGLLRSLLQVIDTSPTPQSQRATEAQPLLSALLDPLCKSIEVQMTESGDPDESSRDSSAATTTTTATRQTVYAINTLCVALSSVLPFDFVAQGRQDAMTALLERCVTRFISAASAKTLERLELDVANKLIVGASPKPSHDSAALALKVFFAAVFSGAGEGFCPLPVPNLEGIQPVRVRERCRREVVAHVCEVYDKIYAAAKEIAGQEDEQTLKMICHHTPEQLRVLLE